MSRRFPLIHIALILILGILVYSNTFEAPFVFDDYPDIVTNPSIMNFYNIPYMFAGGTGMFASRPLIHATLSLNYHFGGLDTTGYHAVNLALHLINGLLLYFLIVMTGRFLKYDDESARPVAFIASALFVVHPVQTEAVIYIVSRSMLLATTFYLSGIMLFARAAERSKWFYIAGLFIVSLLGAASRENFITFPLMLLLYDLFFISNFRAKEALGRWRLYIAILPACAYLVYLVLNNTYDPRAHFIEISIPPLQYIFTQLKVHWTYLRLLALPIGQSIDYSYPLAQTLLGFPTILFFIGYLGLWGASILLARRKPVLSFAILWFLVALTPISIGVALTNLRLGDVIFEHRLYLPSAGIIAAFSAVTVFSAKQFKDKWARTAVSVCLVIVLAVFSIAAFKRNILWQSDIGLWTDVIEKYPANVRAQINLGNAYAEEKLLDEAIYYYHMALSSNYSNVPAAYYAIVHINLANIYLGKGYTDKALRHYGTAISLTPMNPEPYRGLGDAYMEMDIIDKAIKYYRMSIQMNPQLPINYNSLGAAYFKKGLLDMAIENYLMAIKIDSRYAMAYNNLGMAYLQKGHIDKSLEYYERAIRINPEYAKAFSGLGNAYMQKGLVDKAIEYYQYSLSLNPDAYTTHTNLGIAYLKKGMKYEAQRHFSIAESLRKEAGTPEPGVRDAVDPAELQ